jgi:hypothetical protein
MSSARGGWRCHGTTITRAGMALVFPGHSRAPASTLVKMLGSREVHGDDHPAISPVGPESSARRPASVLDEEFDVHAGEDPPASVDPTAGPAASPGQGG